MNGDRSDLITHAIVLAALLAGIVLAGDIFHHIERRGYFTKHRVAVIEKRRRHRGDEKLRAIRARTSIGHGEDAGLVVAQFRVKLIGEFVARATASGFGRVAALQHETINHAVKRNVVVIAAAGQIEEIRASDRS